MAWTLKDMPSQTGRFAIVTGANTGLGYETALALAVAGADVVVAARNQAKGEGAVGRILTAHPDAKVRYEALDLARLSSVAEFARRMLDQQGHLDLLINNAGVMMPPTRQTTAEGFELQFGVNYLAHYALTGHLLGMLRATPKARVVSLSSGAHHTGRINFDDLQSNKRYQPWLSYSQSKLAMLMFAFELQRRSDLGAWGIMSTAAHPGYARTELIASGPGPNSFFSRFGQVIGPLISQSAADGALPTLMAATDPNAVNGGYYGPSGPFEMKGPAKVARVAKQAEDKDLAARLWQVSQDLTGVVYDDA